MKTIFPLFTAACLVNIPSTWAQSQALKQTPPPASAGILNDWLRDHYAPAEKWDLGGQVRARYEYREHFAVLGTPGAVDFSRNSPENSFLLLREKLHLGYRADWFSGFVEARDSSTHNDRRNPNVEADTFDLHQGYITFGNPREFPLAAKIGRQELSYGDERLVGAFDWNNLGRVFDAAKLRLEQKEFWVDAFVGRVVLPDDERFNQPNDYDWFSGIYASSTSWIPKQTTELYFLARNVGQESVNDITTSTPTGGATRRDIYTLGLRFKSQPRALGPWDYDGELAGQFGNFAPTATAERQDHLAFAAHLGGGYTFAKSSLQPRVGLEYNFASGDSNPDDNDHGTFENLFPTNHKFYGYMDFVSWQNIHNARLTASIKPMAKLTVSADYHAFWLADTGDYFYQVNGAPRRAGGYDINESAGNYAGSEVDLVATFAFTRFASVQAGYGHFFAGDYVKDSLGSGSTKDADFVYVQGVLNF